MWKRMLLMLAVMLVIIGALGFVKFRQIQTAMAEGAAFQPPPEAVTTIVAKTEPWPVTLTAIGTMAAVQGVTVSADLPGTVHRIAFESGHAVRRGDVLAELDIRQERAQLAAIEAQRDLARVNYTRLKGLLSERVISQAEFDRADAEQRQTDAQHGEIRATIERKTIRAPFSGVLGIRQANVGQYLAAGDPIVPLQSLHPIYVNFDVPQQDVGQIRVGHQIHVAAKDHGDFAVDGRVTAIDSVVDPTTRNLQIQATVPNPAGTLRPGMFVQTELALGAERSVIALPASAISYAPFGDSVFILTDLKGQNGQTYRGVRQQFVKLGGSRGDQIAVVSGVSAGDEVVSSGVFKLRNGAAVTVNNKVQPGNKRSPKPEDS
jgi:membrane fusion protein, multidrug efflux system